MGRGVLKGVDMVKKNDRAEPRRRRENAEEERQTGSSAKTKRQGQRNRPEGRPQQNRRTTRKELLEKSWLELRVFAGLELFGEF